MQTCLLGPRVGQRLVIRPQHRQGPGPCLLLPVPAVRGIKYTNDCQLRIPPIPNTRPPPRTWRAAAPPPSPRGGARAYQSPGRGGRWRAARWWRPGARGAAPSRRPASRASLAAASAPWSAGGAVCHCGGWSGSQHSHTTNTRERKIHHILQRTLRSSLGHLTICPSGVLVISSRVVTFSTFSSPLRPHHPDGGGVGGDDDGGGLKGSAPATSHDVSSVDSNTRAPNLKRKTPTRARTSPRPRHRPPPVAPRHRASLGLLLPLPLPRLFTPPLLSCWILTAGGRLGRRRRCCGQPSNGVRER